MFELNTNHDLANDARLASLEHKLDMVLEALSAHNGAGGTHTPRTRLSTSVIEEEQGMSPVRHLGDDHLFGNERSSVDEANARNNVGLGPRI